MAQRGFANPRTGIRLVQNWSHRAGHAVTCLAVHTTESHNVPGPADMDGVVSWFDNPVSQASSHYVIDADGNSTQCVLETEKAWTIGAANDFTVNYELIGSAADPEATWLQRMAELKKLAQHLADASRTYKIPLRKGCVGAKNGACVCLRPGVIRHSDVTAAGFGTHTDPGKGFPLRRVILLAIWYRKFGWMPGAAK